MIAAYQLDPANPRHTAAIVTTLDPMIRYLARTRAASLGGWRDARQDAIAEVLGACQQYDLTRDVEVERALMGDVCALLRPKARRGAAALAKEVTLEEAPEGAAPAPSFRRLDLERAIKAKKINDDEMQLLSWRHIDALSWEDIGARLDTTPDTARMRAFAIAQRLSRWADQKNKK
jgi:DNA-directed RNA polymerase specialized sigma24 family protein